MSSARSFVRANEKAPGGRDERAFCCYLDSSTVVVSLCYRPNEVAGGRGGCGADPLRVGVWHLVQAGRIAQDRPSQEAAREDEAANAGDIKLGRVYSQLGLSFEDMAQWDRSEAALKHAVSLLGHAGEKDGELATAIDQLGSLYVTMGRLREAEKEEIEALKLREALNDPLQIARSWVDLAALYLAKNKSDKARDFAQKALTEFVVNQRAVRF